MTVKGVIKELCPPVIMKAAKYALKHPSTTTPNMSGGWDAYYEIAEKAAEMDVEKYFTPILSKYPISFLSCLDFPSGRGRIAGIIYEKYAEQINRFTCCDSNNDAIGYCRHRFANNGKFFFATNSVDEYEVEPLEFENKSFTFIYSWDAMVHFSYKWIDFYIGEFYRMLHDGGYVFIHHSNLGSPNVSIGREKGESWGDNPHGRTPISARDVARIAQKQGFTVTEQKCIDWGQQNSRNPSVAFYKNYDCITLLHK